MDLGIFQEFLFMYIPAGILSGVLMTYIRTRGDSARGGVVEVVTIKNTKKRIIPI